MKPKALVLLFVLALATAAYGQPNMSEFERDFAGDDPVRRYYFREYFSGPVVERAFRELKAGTGRN